MRIVIDLQGAQSTGSRTRGIGRYSMALTRMLAAQPAGHEIYIVLNGAYPETIKDIRLTFDQLLPQNNIKVWTGPTPASHLEKENNNRRYAAELIYEAFIDSLCPDFILITSLFEGAHDNIVTSIKKLNTETPVAVILYDLIPYLHPEKYSQTLPNYSWNLDKLNELRKADLWLSISESSRNEGICYLGLPESKVINISCDADEKFQPATISEREKAALLERHGLKKPYVMYTGGIDHRKNIEGLIEGFSLIPRNIRSNFQLVVVCSIRPENVESLTRVASDCGLEADELILTGFVSDSDLVALYRLCELFVFPSHHEGFGLPLLEAMRCGSPVIGSNSSSIPEVIGCKEALFDPNSKADIARLIERALCDPEFRSRLTQHSANQEKKFSWEKSAQIAIASMEKRRKLDLIEKDNKNRQMKNASRKKLAYVSPLPPSRTGIADYSAELIQELEKYYEIELIAAGLDALSQPEIFADRRVHDKDWLIENSGLFDRVVYQFGNSEFHTHMFELLQKIPGVVVLHDFFLSGVQIDMDANGTHPNGWTKALYEGHGYQAVVERYRSSHPQPILWKYPTNLSVLQQALGIIAHSDHSRALAEKWYGPVNNDLWHNIPLLRSSPTSVDRNIARKSIGISDDDVLVCSFGVINPTKLNHRLLETWLSSELSNSPKIHLIFVGENHGGEYGSDLLRAISKSDNRNNIQITGWVNQDTFRTYLAAADIGVQLRAFSRGETSGTALDCMNYGLATIVNGHGSLQELDHNAVWMLPDDFTNHSLWEALSELIENKERRDVMGQNAQTLLRQNHNPRSCASLYYQSIESTYEQARHRLHAVTHLASKLSWSESETKELATCLAESFPPVPKRKQLLIDVTKIRNDLFENRISQAAISSIQSLFGNTEDIVGIEPVYFDGTSNAYRYAKEFVCCIFDIPSDWADDECVIAWEGDVLVVLDEGADRAPPHHRILEIWEARGIEIHQRTMESLDGASLKKAILLPSRPILND